MLQGLAVNRRSFISGAFLLVASQALPRWCWPSLKPPDSGYIYTPEYVDFDVFFTQTVKDYAYVLAKNFLEYRPAVALLMATDISNSPRPIAYGFQIGGDAS